MDKCGNTRMYFNGEIDVFYLPFVKRRNNDENYEMVLHYSVCRLHITIHVTFAAEY